VGNASNRKEIAEEGTWAMSSHRKGSSMGSGRLAFNYNNGNRPMPGVAETGDKVLNSFDSPEKESVKTLKRPTENKGVWTCKF